METMNRLIWCAVCATEIGLPLVSWRGDGVAARWGLVGVPITSCDHCHGRLAMGQIAVAVSSYENPSDYAPWEPELLTDLDAEPMGDREGCSRD